MIFWGTQLPPQESRGLGETPDTIFLYLINSLSSVLLTLLGWAHKRKPVSHGKSIAFKMASHLFSCLRQESQCHWRRHSHSQWQWVWWWWLWDGICECKWIIRLCSSLHCVAQGLPSSEPHFPYCKCSLRIWGVSSTFKWEFQKAHWENTHTYYGLVHMERTFQMGLVV